MALFGGSFDPIHRGHCFIAEKAIERCQLDELIFLPCRTSPHKLGVETAPGEARLEMVRLAIADMERATASDWELAQEGVSYSWETAEHWRDERLAEEDELFWLLGMDQWNALDRWARIDHLAKLVTFIVFPRHGEVPEAREGLRATFLPDAMAVSATDIRTRYRLGESITNDVGASVAMYIRENGLYQSA